MFAAAGRHRIDDRTEFRDLDHRRTETTMPNDPQPTTDDGYGTRHAPVTVHRPTDGPIDVYADIIQVVPEQGKKFKKGDDITLILRAVIGVSSTATTSFDFELSLTSEHDSAKATFGSNKFSFPPGTFTTCYLEVTHFFASPGTYQINALICAASAGTGRFQYLASIPEIDGDVWSYDVR